MNEPGRVDAGGTGMLIHRFADSVGEENPTPPALTRRVEPLDDDRVAAVEASQ